VSLDSALFEAARAQSDQSLGTLATKVKMIHAWNDLILPRPTLQRVKEITAAIRHRHVVYSEWGFEKRIAAGLGLKVLFSGASGTGKTMTAGVIARDLGLDLYKIDLSGIVSKYIGETEKNLDRIFCAAQCSNAILFFDEADALFGKRSEVKDAHDRYANIEVAYLLQKIEEYAGIVILASNLSKNIDEAFSRRMHYVVEFPLPDETHRERLWRGMFPAQVPLGEDVDFQFLARQFPIPGGDIRNVALEAAFLAAQNGKIVTMKQLATALARQMIKQGKIPSATDFKQHHALIFDCV
jgi:SpoVK/Ycf46/Vps4 family AAA+-type ATPase